VYSAQLVPGCLATMLGVNATPSMGRVRIVPTTSSADQSPGIVSFRRPVGPDWDARKPFPVWITGFRIKM
jgi:hypothetical protein